MSQLGQNVIFANRIKQTLLEREGWKRSNLFNEITKQNNKKTHTKKENMYTVKLQWN